jgi:hypothetical protein
VLKLYVDYSPFPGLGGSLPGELLLDLASRPLSANFGLTDYLGLLAKVIVSLFPLFPSFALGVA